MIYFVIDAMIDRGFLGLLISRHKTPQDGDGYIRGWN